VRLDCSQVSREWMARLVQSDPAATGQPETGESPPSLFGYVLDELDALGLQVTHGGFQVVAHEIQLVPGRAGLQLDQKAAQGRIVRALARLERGGTVALPARKFRPCQ